MMRPLTYERRWYKKNCRRRARAEKEEKEEKKLKGAEKRISMIKKLVLLKKRQAVNQGAGADVTV